MPTSPRHTRAPRTAPDGGAWHPERVKAELRILFGSTKAAAAAWGVDPSLIAQVLRRPLASIPVERRIAAALGVPPQTIWPGRWSADGNPLPRSGPKAATRKPAIPSQNREAA